MMDFLRGLAPSRQEAATRATVRLPSRFSGLRPLRATAFAVAARDVRPAAFDVMPGGPNPQPTAEIAAQRSNREVPRVFASDAATTPAMRAPEQKSDGAKSPRAQSPEAVLRRGVPERNANDSVNATRDTRRRLAKHVVERSATEAHVTQPALRAGLPRPTPRGIAEPLSAAALLERPAARSDRRPIVQVTIDRLEVRAPATAARSVPPGRPRAKAPAVSLGEYLRAPKGSGGGA